MKKQNNKTLKTFTQFAQEKHSTTVIFLHGLGNEAKDWLTSARQIKDKYPYTKFIIPQAPIIPASINHGAKMSAWYDLKENSYDALNLQEDKVGLLNSVTKIEQIVQQEIGHGITPRRILVIGFSQGAAVAVAVGLMADQQLGVIISLNGFLPLCEEIFKLAKVQNKTIPFFLYHSRLDNIVSAWIGAKSTKLLKTNGYQVEFSDEYNGTHFF